MRVYVGEFNKKIYDLLNINENDNIKRTDLFLLKLVDKNLIIDVDDFYINNNLFLLDNDYEIYKQNYKTIIKYSQLIDITPLLTFITIITEEKFKEIILSDNFDYNFQLFSSPALIYLSKIIPSLNITLALIDFSKNKKLSYIIKEYLTKDKKRNYILICQLALALFNKFDENTFLVKDRLQAQRFILEVHNFVHIYLSNNKLFITPIY